LAYVNKYNKVLNVFADRTYKSYLYLKEWKTNRDFFIGTLGLNPFFQSKKIRRI